MSSDASPELTSKAAPKATKASRPPLDPAHAAARAQLLQALAPLLRRIAELKPQEADSPAAVQSLQSTLEREFPYRGDSIQEIRNRLAQGIQAGWACNRGPDSARFSRLAKPSPETFDLSVDAVDMEGPAIEHTHPQGEISLAFPAPGVADTECNFDQNPPGWVFLGPGTRHVPTVTGGRMQIIYFLPAGEVLWH